MTKAEFRKLKVSKRYFLLKKSGIHIASRNHSGYFVHLFSLDGFFVEVWVLIGIGQIQWIEIQDNQAQIELYIEKFNLGDLF